MADVLRYRELSGLWSARVEDGSDTDQNPDVALLTGNVRFVPQFRGNFVSYPMLCENVLPRTIHATLTAGNLTTTALIGGNLVEQPVRLLTTDDPRANQEWAWELHYDDVRVAVEEEALNLAPQTFTVPDAETGPLCIPRQAGVYSGGVITVQGPPGPGIESIVAENGQITLTLENGESTTIPVPEAVPGMPGPVGPQGEKGDKGDPGSIENLEEQVQTLVPQTLDGLDVVYGGDDRLLDRGVSYAWSVKDTDGKVALAVTQDGSAIAPDLDVRHALLAGAAVEESTGPLYQLKDSTGKVALSVNDKGEVLAPDLRSRRHTLAGMTTEESKTSGWAIKDAAGKVALAVREDGRVFLGDLDPESGITGGGPTVSQVIVLWGVGQSNSEGRGLPVSPRLDPVHPRVHMAAWDGVTVTGVIPATVPLDSQHQQIGLSPQSVIAREIVAAEEGIAVVIVNAARGGSALVYDTANGVWAVDYAGSNTHLLPIAKDALTATLAHVRALYPGVPVDVQIVWHQGESDGSTPYQEYADALDALIADLRAHIGDQTAPIVMGGLVPERQTEADRTRSMAAQMGAQARLQYVGFAQGVPNGGGSQDTEDITHYSRQGVEELGRRMYEALRRAYINRADSVPLPPLDVSATIAGDTLSIEWEFPFCRATGFTVEYQIDGGAWTTVTGRDVPLLPAATVTGITGTTIRVRVSTTNENGTSAYSTPITAIGA